MYIYNASKILRTNKNKKQILLNLYKHIYYPIVYNFTYIKHIQYNKLNVNKFNSIYKHSQIYRKTVCSNILFNKNIALKIKHNIYDKFFFIEHNTSKKKYTQEYLASNIYIPSTHKHFLIYNIDYDIKNNTTSIIQTNNSVIIVNKILNYYTTWGTPSFNIYKYNIFKGIHLKKIKETKFKTSADITAGLSSIESIFELYTLSFSNNLSPNLSILSSVFNFYEESSLSHNTLCTLFDLNTTYISVLKNIETEPSLLYESVSSILMPQYSITSKNMSINKLNLSIYSTILNFYNQEQAIYLTHLYSFNLIVESLTKQYYANNIIIPSIQFEIIAKKMTSFVSLESIGESSFNTKDIFEFSILQLLNTSFNLFGYTQLIYKPIILGVSKSVLACSGFLSSISFQEILKNIINVSMYSSIDWITDLKASIITSDFIQAGSGWYRHFSYI